MPGIDFVDTLVVRHSVDKGTKIISEPLKKLNWAGHEFKKFEKKRRMLAGNLGLASSKGTKIIHLGKMPETQIPSIKGLYLSVGRGTGLRQG